MAKKKKEVYQRPKDWDKTIQRSYWDKDKTYDGSTDAAEKEDAEREREEASKKAGKGRFGKLLKKLIGGK